MLGSSQFIGWMLASLFIPRLGDLKGRKLPFISCMVVAAFVHVVILFTADINLMILLIFINGLTQAGRFSLAHVYL